MVAIYMFIFKVLYWITSVLQENFYHCLDQYPTNEILSLIFFPDDSKQDAATKVAHSKRKIESLNKRNVIYTVSSAIW